MRDESRTTAERRNRKKVAEQKESRRTKERNGSVPSNEMSVLAEERKSGVVTQGIQNGRRT
jgi:hypothetical protein